MDGKIFRLPRKHSKRECQKHQAQASTSKKHKMGFTMRASCAPWKKSRTTRKKQPSQAPLRGGGGDSYPNTDTTTLMAITKKIRNWTSVDVQGSWREVRNKLMDISGLSTSCGHTSHCFNDWNHVDLLCVDESKYHLTNQESQVLGIDHVNSLEDVIRHCTSQGQRVWTTCMMGCSREEEPQDVAHQQFKCKIAFKLVWLPGLEEKYDRFCLLDEEGDVLIVSGVIDFPEEQQHELHYDHYPVISERQENHQHILQGHQKNRYTLGLKQVVLR